MATHITLTGGTVLTVESELGEVAAALSVEGKLVALPSTFGGTFYVNPGQVLYLEESKEVGAGPAGNPALAVPEPPAPQSPSQPPPPSQAPPG